MVVDITYESNLFHQTIQTKYLCLCFLNVTFKDSNLKEKNSLKKLFRFDDKNLLARLG